MAKGDIAPTKSNLLELRRDVTFAREGFELLDEKRQILVLELMRHVERAKRLQEETDEAMAAAYREVREAVLGAGRRQLAGLGAAVETVTTLRVRSHRLMGLYLPAVEVSRPERKPRYGLGVTSSQADRLHGTFEKLVPLLAELAEVENTVVRLARELRKTQRRVNALEKLFIPDTEANIKYISETLEEREREALGIMRIVKRRGEAADALAGLAFKSAAEGDAAREEVDG